MEYNPYSPLFIKSILKSKALRLFSSRGQNYLIDRNYAERIVSLVPEGSIVFEVGSGLGALTYLLQFNHKVYSLEIDKGIYNLLKGLLKSPNLFLLNEDFLKFDMNSILEESLFFISNLPYSVAGEIIKMFIDASQFKEGIVMVQEEMLERMLARSATGQFSVFSILCQFYMEIEKLFGVGRKSFFPEPSVDSAVVRIRKKDVEILQKDFYDFLKKAFHSRRKTIINNLRKYGFNEAVFEKLDLSYRFRPEEIPVEKWRELFIYYKGNFLEKLQ